MCSLDRVSREHKAQLTGAVAIFAKYIETVTISQADSSRRLKALRFLPRKTLFQSTQYSRILRWSSIGIQARLGPRLPVLAIGVLDLILSLVV